MLGPGNIRHHPRCQSYHPRSRFYYCRPPPLALRDGHYWMGCLALSRTPWLRLCMQRGPISRLLSPYHFSSHRIFNCVTGSRRSPPSQPRIARLVNQACKQSRPFHGPTRSQQARHFKHGITTGPAVDSPQPLLLPISGAPPSLISPRAFKSKRAPGQTAGRRSTEA